MQEFNDSKRRLFRLEITAGSVRKKILARMGVDLLEPERDREKLFDMLRSTTRMMDLIYCLVENQLVDVNEDKFWDEFDAPDLAKAIEAARKEIDFFIQTCQPNTTVLARLRKAAKIEELERQKVEAFLDSGEVESMVDEEVDRLITQATAQLRKSVQSVSSPTSLPDTLESISTG